MNGNCHFVYGATVGSMIALNIDKIAIILPHINISAETTTLFIMGGILGGIFPDIDNPSSHMGKLSVPVSTVIGAINKKVGKVGANHRGILHDPIVYLIGMILSYIFIPSLIGFFIGCLSHIFLDMFNPRGVPFLLCGNIKLGKIESGSTKSVIFTWVCVFLSIIIGCLIKFI